MVFRKEEVMKKRLLIHCVPVCKLTTNDDESPFIHDSIQNYSRLGASMHAANHPEGDAPRDQLTTNR